MTYRAMFHKLEERWPHFGPMLERLGSRQIRNRGTVGGNIGNASPIGDMPPALIALGAELDLDSVDGTRRLRLEDFFHGYKQTDLQPHEFIRGTWIDRMLDMGFIPDVKRIIRKCTPKEERQTLLFSATFNQDVLNLASMWTKSAEFVEITPITAAPCFNTPMPPCTRPNTRVKVPMLSLLRK